VSWRSLGLGIDIASIGLFLDHGWAHWPAIISATFIALQGFAYVAWSLRGSLDPGVVLGLIEPILVAVIVIHVLRHRPPGVSWNARLP
jgi:hypothetical protein